MAEQSTHINYSFEDIQRYLNGAMTAAEMHDVEKAALQDPFLADAIEGFNEADLTVARQHLNEINASLIKEKKKSKIVAFNKRAQWLNIAAVIILLAGIAVVLSYFLNSSTSNQKTQVAQMKNEPAKNEVLKDSAATGANTITKNPDANLLVAENKSVKKTASPSREKNAGQPVITAADNAMQKDETSSVASVAAAPAVMQQNEMEPKSYADKLNNNADSIQYMLKGKVSGVSVLPATFSGKVIDENNKPVSGALIQSADKKAAVITDVSGNFSMQKTDSVLNVTASTIGYNTKTANLTTNNNNVIRLKGANSNLNDVVVTTALGTSKKQKSFFADSAQPVGGWQNFNNYVLTQLNKDTTSEIVTNAHDLVEIEFFIDNQGNPYNIKLVKRLDEERNAKAIDILKNGPKWTNTSKKKKAKVVIEMPQQ